MQCAVFHTLILFQIVKKANESCMAFNTLYIQAQKNIKRQPIVILHIKLISLISKLIITWTQNYFMTLLFPLCPNHSSACCFQLVKNAFLQTDFTKFILVRIGAKVSFSEKPSMQMYFSLIFLCTRSLIPIVISENSTFHCSSSLNSCLRESEQKNFLVKWRWSIELAGVELVFRLACFLHITSCM